MSTRILVEFNTDCFQDWPPEIQEMMHQIRYAKDGHLRLERKHQGIEQKWERHHTDPCPVEVYREK